MKSFKKYVEEKNWIQNAVKHPGSLKRAAKRKKKSISDYCKKPPSSKAEKKCNFWKTLNSLRDK